MWLALYIGLGLALVLVFAIALILVTHVEDWGRDLTTNYATTSDDAADQRLRPIDAGVNPAELAAVVVRCAAELPRWQLAERSDEPGQIRLHFVRTTGLVGYKDDIRVRIEPAGNGSRLSAESQSRIGKGDLGQNPRNLRELLGKIRASLP